MLMYGSSFRMLTGTPRALRMRPMLAAVMPLPRELVTPPVTKTYFGIGLPRTSWWLERAAEAGRCWGRARVGSPLVYSGSDHTAPQPLSASPVRSFAGALRGTGHLDRLTILVLLVHRAQDLAIAGRPGFG